MSNEFSRRSFLKGGLATTVAVSALESLIQGLVSKAYAESLGIDPRTYIMLYQAGGIPMWMWNLPLNPFPGQTLIPNIGASNDFSGGSLKYTTTTHVINGQVFQLPKIWATNLPRPDGSSVPMIDLFKSCCIMRGIEYNINSHGTNALQLLRPDPTAPSITGLVADAADPAKFPIPALSTSVLGSSYLSRKIGQKNLKSVSYYVYPLTEIISAFKADPAMKALLDRRDLFSAAYNSVVTAMKNRAVVANSKSAPLYQNLASFETLVKRNFDNLNSVWESLVTKYINLIKASKSISDILTEPISPSAFTNAQKALGRTIDFGSGKEPAFVKNSDFRSIIDVPNPQVVNLAESFSVAEFLITEGLSSAISLDIGGPGNFSVEVTNASGSQSRILTGNEGYIGLDMHDEGIAHTIPQMTFNFKAISACLFELISVLKSKNKYDETVIQYGSEFTRSPKDYHTGSGSTYNDQHGRGSDHGYNGTCYTIFSGAIKQPMILGNIRTNHPASPGGVNHYPGTWGEAATVNFDGSNDTVLNWGNAASSVCTALRVEPVMPNFRSILTEDSSGNIIANINNGENREE